MAVAMAPGAPDHSGIHCEISPGWWLNHVKSHVFSADSPFKSFKLKTLYNSQKESGDVLFIDGYEALNSLAWA